MFKQIFISIVCGLILFSCSTKKENVDLIIHNAVIYSVDSSFTMYEAIAIKNGKIIELNTSEALLKKYTSGEIKDAGGKIIFPGFIDAHCHFLGYGLGLRQVDLTGTKSFKEVIQRVKDFAISSDGSKKPILKGEDNWVIGRGWDQNDWEQKEFPDKEMLDSLFPNTPVILKRIDGHAALVNTEALRRANITLTTRINGGDILIKAGRLTGILIDNAVDLVTTKIPPASTQQLQEALLAAQQNCFKVGLTTVDDAGLMKNDVGVMDALQKSNHLKMRVYAMLSDSGPNYKYYLEKGVYKTDRLNVCSFKFYADGALGSRGACLIENYSDKANWKGFLLSTKEHFEKYAKILAEKGFQMNTHCIGDSSDRLIAQIYKDALNSQALSKHRWRIEHAQVVDKSDLEKFSFIIPSVQPTHATSDMYWAKDRLGEARVKNAYAYKDLLHAAGLVALGTDFPVEDISPFKTFYAAVARKDGNGFPASGFQVQNALTREEAIKGMTIWAAYSNFEEKEKGSLEKGKLADFVILDTDMMKCEVKDVLKTKVIATYINGEKVFSVNSCFPHFSKTSSVGIDFIEKCFEFGCPVAIFEDVYSKKAQ